MINKLSLINWKSHEETQLEFKPGTNVILGNMGAGKSSILQAISFALFGTFSELKKREVKLEDVVTRGKGAKTSEISLDLSEEIQIKRTIQDGKTSEAVIRQADALLAGPNPMQVTSFIQNNLRIDEDIFLRTVYAKQNEIDLFLKLNPAERKMRLDQIMELDKFETARKNSVKLANQLKIKKETKETFLSGFNLEEFEGKVKSLKDECATLFKQKDDLVKDISNAENLKKSSEAELQNLRKVKEEQTRLEERRTLLVRESNEIKQKLFAEEFTQDLNMLMTELNDTKARLSERQRSKQSAEAELDRNQTKIREIENKFGVLKGQQSALKEDMKKLANSRFELQELEKKGNLDAIKTKISDTEKRIELKNYDSQIRIGEVNVITKSMQDLKRVQGKCPVCESDMPEEKKRALEQERQNRVLTLRKEAENIQAEVNKFKIELQDLKQVADKQSILLQTVKPEAELMTKERQITEQLIRMEGEKTALDGMITRMKEHVGKINKDVTQLDEKLKKLNDNKNMYDMKVKQKSLLDEIAKIEHHLNTHRFDANKLREQETQFQGAIRRAQELTSKREGLIKLLEEKEKTLVELENKKEQFVKIQEEIKLLNANIEFLSKFKNALLHSQETLRKELLLAVNEIMTNIWQALYPYGKWSGVRLLADESDYILQIKETDGDWVNVAGFASGGERMLACLALRIAFAKIMAPNISMLILDEPTHNLDEQAIKQLTEVIQEKLTGYLDQLFIVTHDEKLAECGDHVIKIN